MNNAARKIKSRMEYSARRADIYQRRANELELNRANIDKYTRLFAKVNELLIETATLNWCYELINKE